MLLIKSKEFWRQNYYNKGITPPMSLLLSDMCVVSNLIETGDRVMMSFCAIAERRTYAKRFKVAWACSNHLLLQLEENPQLSVRIDTQQVKVLFKVEDTWHIGIDW